MVLVRAAFWPSSASYSSLAPLLVHRVFLDPAAPLPVPRSGLPLLTPDCVWCLWTQRTHQLKPTVFQCHVGAGLPFLLNYFVQRFLFLLHDLTLTTTRHQPLQLTQNAATNPPPHLFSLVSLLMVALVFPPLMPLVIVFKILHTCSILLMKQPTLH